MHHNVPGVLATVNGVLADFGVNIEGQMLSTRGELGYVITDVGGRSTPALHGQAAGPARDRTAAGHRLRPLLSALTFVLALGAADDLT